METPEQRQRRDEALDRIAEKAADKFLDIAEAILDGRKKLILRVTASENYRPDFTTANFVDYEIRLEDVATLEPAAPGAA